MMVTCDRGEVGPTREAATTAQHKSIRQDTPWVAGYRRSPRGRQRRPIIRSITHAPDQTLTRSQLFHCGIDLAGSEPLLSYPGAMLISFRGLQALKDTHEKHPGTPIRPVEFRNH